MPQVFLSYASENRAIVRKVREALNQSLINTWMDEKNIPGSARLIEEIAPAIHQSQYFFPFISDYYLKSPWCQDELRRANALCQQGKIKILPILLKPMDQLHWTALSEGQRAFIEPLLQQTNYVLLDRRNPAASIPMLLDKFWKNELIQFDPIRTVTVGRKKVQLIHWDTKGSQLPANFLETWGLNVEQFIAKSKSKKDTRPIREGLPVAFSGQSINWLIAFLTIPFKNQRTVYVFNQQTQGYVCVYSLADDKAVGKVLK